MAAEYLLRLGRGREAFRTALEGMRRAEPTAMLWSHVSEAYVAKGDLEAALRARRTAAALEPDVQRHWLRLVELLEALDRPVEAAEARERAGSLPADARSGPGEVGA